MDNPSIIPDSSTDSSTVSNGGLLSAEQAAQYLNLSESFVRKAVAGKRIPFVRIGTRTLFRRADLEWWISEHVVTTNSEIHGRAESRAASAMLHTQRRRKRVAQSAN